MDYYKDLNKFVDSVKKDKSLESRLYIIKNKRVCKSKSLEQFIDWFNKEDPDLLLWLDRIKNTSIVTAFFGYDIGINDSQPVMLESVIIGGTLDGQKYRYGSYGEARAGHQRRLKRVRDLEV